MALQRFLNSRHAGVLGLRLSRALSPKLGFVLANLLADRVATRKKLPIVRAIRANQWVISGEKLSASQLDQATRQNLRFIAHDFYTLFHHIDDPDALIDLVEFTPRIDRIIEDSRHAKKGVIVAGVHLSNFDLVAQAAAVRGLRALALSLPESPQPDDAIEWQHAFRRQSGIEILPASLANFRQVITRLQAGETVLTGVDHPFTEVKNRPSFFGRPAHLPMHYTHFALKAGVPIVIMASILGPDGVYHILSSDEIEMEPCRDHQEAILINAEKVLRIAASFISQAPLQWATFYPVWPEALEEAPE